MFIFEYSSDFEHPIYYTWDAQKKVEYLNTYINCIWYILCFQWNWWLTIDGARLPFPTTEGARDYRLIIIGQRKCSRIVYWNHIILAYCVLDVDILKMLLFIANISRWHLYTQYFMIQQPKNMFDFQNWVSSRQTFKPKQKVISE